MERRRTATADLMMKPMTHARTATDDELMAAVRDGDSSAFAALTERHRGWVTGVIRAYVGTQETAEDLAQETFLRIHASREGYQGKGSFVAWAKRIAVNLSRDHLRRRKNAPHASLDDLEESAADEKDYDPMELLEVEALQDDLRTAISALPSEQRLTLVMHYFGDMSVKEIAWAMQCPEGTARSRLFNALRRVRRSLTIRWAFEGDTK
jgi:RNA polymerase sigma-70 factor (ECF subfamily)